MNFAKDWSDLIDLHRTAQSCQDIIENPTASRIAKEAAVNLYPLTCDKIVAVMTRLSQAGLLGRVTMMVIRKPEGV